MERSDFAAHEFHGRKRFMGIAGSSVERSRSPIAVWGFDRP